jgi:hypothetical protein
MPVSHGVKSGAHRDRRLAVPTGSSPTSKRVSEGSSGHGGCPLGGLQYVLKGCCTLEKCLPSPTRGYSTRLGRSEVGAIDVSMDVLDTDREVKWRMIE